MAEDTLAGAASAENPATGADPGAGGDKAADPAVAAAAAAAEVGKTADVGKEKADAGKTAEADKGAADKGKADPEPEGQWGKDWREKLANGDAKRLERLARFASPEALLQAQEEAQRKISEGLKPKGRPGEKATAEELTAYRKEHGIPDKVDDYVKAIELPDKRQIGEADMPAIKAFSERALSMNIPPADIAGLVDEYYKIQEETQFQVKQADSEFRKEAEKTLKEEWGGDFEGNFAAMRPYFNSVDGELFDNLMGGRMADGRKIGNHPAMLKFFAHKAVAENPLATVMPASGSAASSIDTEIKTLEKRMGEDRHAWFKDEKAQKRLQALYSARDKLPAA